MCVDALRNPSISGHEMEPPAVRRCLPHLLPKHTIFLSHSGEQKAFVEQLCEDLKQVNHSPFFDQESDSLPKGERFASLIFEAAEECWLAVVVLSRGYLTSKWPMLELSAFVKARKTKNPELKLLPLFYKLSPGDLDAEKVETEWVESWKLLVQEGKVRAEEVGLWSDAVRELRAFNGLEFSKYGTSEVKYGAAVVDEICKCVSPVMKYNTDRMRGYQRMCEKTSSMFEEGMVEEDICKQGRFYLGLHGVGGVGKTTLCGAMCSYFQAGFRGRVCHVELQGNAESDRIARLKHAIDQLSGFDSRAVDRITSESQVVGVVDGIVNPGRVGVLKSRLRDQPPVFIAVDNVGDAESSREEARAYLNAGLACGSKVMVTSRSRVILESILGKAKYCKPIPRLDALEAEELFLSVAAPTRLLSALEPAEDEIVKACVRECQFAEDGYSCQQYHPLVLRALGSYFHDVDNGKTIRWKEALLVKNKRQGSRESKHVTGTIGLNYSALSDIQKMIFLDVAFLFNADFLACNGLPDLARSWWEERTLFEWEVSFIATLHGLSPFEVEMEVKELQRKSLIYESGARLSMHDLYIEFAHALVEKEGSKEREWWLCSDNMDRGSYSGVKRLCLEVDKLEIFRNPEQLWQWHSLQCFVMIGCNFPEDYSLDLGSFKSLRVLVLHECCRLVEIVSNCANTSNGVPCYERKGGGEGCIRHLRTVKVDLERVPFLRHCSNLQCIRLSGYGRGIDLSDFTRGDAQLFENMKALEVLSLCSVPGRYHDSLDQFFDELLKGTTTLKNLKVLEIDIRWKKHVAQGSGTIDLSPLRLLTSLSILHLGSLPINIEELKGLDGLSQLTTLRSNDCGGLCELKGLDQLSQLTTLDLDGCERLRNLPDLDLLPTLQRLCIHECCSLHGYCSLQDLEFRFEEVNYGYDDFQHDEHECLVSNHCNWVSCEVCVIRYLDRGCSSPSRGMCNHLRAIADPNKRCRGSSCYMCYLLQLPL